jgi:hypothetical protein
MSAPVDEIVDRHRTERQEPGEQGLTAAAVFTGLDETLAHAFPHVDGVQPRRALRVTLETARALLAAIDDRIAASTGNDC